MNVILETGVIRWRYEDESHDDFGWPNYGRILKKKKKKKERKMTVGYGIGMFGYNMICLLIGLLIAYYIINNYDG